MACNPEIIADVEICNGNYYVVGYIFVEEHAYRQEKRNRRYNYLHILISKDFHNNGYICYI